MPNPDSKIWMDEALRLAAQAGTEDEVPIGAIVVHEGKIVGCGYNRREQDRDPLGHAEIAAIREASKTLGAWRLLGATLVVTLEPCPMCLAACQQARVAKVIYGAADPKGGALSLGYKLHEDPRSNHRFTVESAPDPRCESILKEFFKKKRFEKT